MSDDKDIEEVFQELQQLSLIKEDRKLIKNEYPILENILPWYARNFKARQLTRNIQYDPRYQDLDEDVLRFALLHEEGHLRYGSRSILYGYIGFFAVICSTFFLMVLGVLSGWKQTWSMAFVIFVGIFIYRISVREKTHNSEFLSDQYAAESLKRCFFVDEPSKVLKKAAKEMKVDVSKSKGSVLKLLLKISGGKTHPKVDKRISRIERSEDR